MCHFLSSWSRAPEEGRRGRVCTLSGRGRRQGVDGKGWTKVRLRTGRGDESGREKGEVSDLGQPGQVCLGMEGMVRVQSRERQKLKKES